jgi:hypothetical protein
MTVLTHAGTETRLQMPTGMAGALAVQLDPVNLTDSWEPGF